MAKSEPKPQFDVGGYLQSKGYEFSRQDDEGNIRVITPGGDEAKFDAPGFFKQKGLDPAKYDISYNSPDAPSDISPLSAIERSKLAVGNTKGSINYLKSKFDQVSVHPDNGILVKKNGVWSQVDPSGLGGGDAWDMAKELGRDIAEGVVGYGPSAVLSTAGAAGAGTLGIVSGPGAVAAAAAGAAAGGAAAEGIKTSLGRIVGTYDATPMEQLKDIGWEGMLNAGGQVVGMGVKPGIAMLGKALKPISDKATPIAKDALAQVWGLSTGAGPTRVRYAMDAPEDVMSYLGQVSKAGSAIEAENSLKDIGIAEAKSLMAPARKVLSSKFGELQSDFLENVPASMEFKVQDMLKQSMMQMEESGLGKIVANKKGVGRFELHSQPEIDKKLAQGNIPDVVDTKSVEALQDFVSEMNKFAAVPTMKGKPGAEAVLKIKRSLSDAFYSITDDKAPNIKRAVANYSAKLNNYLAGVFDNSKVPGLANKFGEMNNTYTKFSGAVQEADRMLREVNGAEIFVNKLASMAGANRTLKGTAGALAELLGPMGEKKINNILAADAARGFIGYMPNLGRLSTAGAAAFGAGAGAASGAIAANPMVAGALASQSSPRLVMKQIQYASKFKDFLSGMSPATRDEWLRSPEAVTGTVRTLMGAYMNEEKQTEEMLKQAGVIQPQQGQ